METKISFGSFKSNSKSNTNQFSESIKNHDKIKNAFCLDNPLKREASCESCKNKSIFGSLCIKCLNYQKYKFVCANIVKSATNMDQIYASSIQKLQMDTTCCIIESIKIKIYNEVIRTIQQGNPKAAFFWLNNAFYILLHFSDSDIVPDGLKSLLENIPGKHEYVLYHRVMNTPSFCIKFQFVLKFGDYSFTTNTYVTTIKDFYNKGNNDNGGSGDLPADMNEENTVVLSIGGGEPTKFQIENWGNKLKEHIFDDIVKKVCLTKIQKNIPNANLSLFIRRCQKFSQNTLQDASQDASRNTSQSKVLLKE